MNLALISADVGRWSLAPLLREGDQIQAEETLWRQRVQAILRRSGVKYDDIEDLCQEVAISYFQVRGVAPWDDTPLQIHLLSRLLKAALSDYYADMRARSLLQRYVEQVPLPTTGPSGLFEAEIADLLQHLSHEQRTIIVMKVLEGYTFAEIGELLSCNENTVKTRYYRTIASLRKALHTCETIETILASREINNTENKTKQVHDHASPDADKSGTSPYGSCGGGIPLLAGTAIYRNYTFSEGCSGTASMSVVNDPFRWAMSLITPTHIIITCPPGGSDYRTDDTWCQRVVNSDCDGWLGSRADYLRKRNKCWWVMDNYVLVTCGQWQPWDCCYEQEATPEPPCPRSRSQIYCTPVTPAQCP